MNQPFISSLLMPAGRASLFAATISLRLFAAAALVLCSLTLSACQKEPEAETPADTQAATDVQTTPVTTSMDHNKNIEGAEREALATDEVAAATEREINLADLENNIGATGVTTNAETTTASPEQNIKGTQITEVKYRSKSGDNLSVIFETSATGVLNAIVILPNKQKMTLSAPEGQGNNPTYHSKDGTIELISHGGGSSIDLMQNNKVRSFAAMSAEAEVITE